MYSRYKTELKCGDKKKVKKAVLLILPKSCSDFDYFASKKASRSARMNI